jgi:hypothetical protein
MLLPEFLSEIESWSSYINRAVENFGRWFHVPVTPYTFPVLLGAVLGIIIAGILLLRDYVRARRQGQAIVPEHSYTRVPELDLTEDSDSIKTLSNKEAKIEAFLQEEEEEEAASF